MTRGGVQECYGRNCLAKFFSFLKTWACHRDGSGKPLLGSARFQTDGQDQAESDDDQAGGFGDDANWVWMQVPLEGHIENP